MNLTSECAELSHDSVHDVGDLDESGVVGLGDQRAPGDVEAADVDVDHVGADFDGGELEPEAAISFVHDLVGNVRAFLGA